MSKTPISILQDVCVKLGTLPVYTEMSSATGTHQNQFVNRVTWKNYTAEATASNKKEAKQNAAKKMLSLLSSSKEIPEILLSIVEPKTNVTVSKESDTSTIVNDLYSVTSSSDDLDIQEKFVNYVGLLNEHCQQYNFLAPIYKDITIAGPSHQPVFTVSCTAGSVYQEGSANTKKAAKHKAAKEVLQALQSNTHSNIKFNTKTSDTLDNLDVEFMELSINQFKYDEFNRQKIVTTYGKLTQKPVVLKSCIKVDEYDEILSNLCHNIPITNQNYLKKMYGIFFVKDSNTLKTVLCEAFKTNMEEITFNARNSQSAIGLKLNIYPVIFQFGIGITKEEAKKNALRKLFEFVFLWLK